MFRSLPLVLAAAALPLGACSFGRAEDSGPMAQRAFPVSGPFTALAVAGPYEVKVVSGGTPGVSAQGGEKALDDLVVEVKDGALSIHPVQRSGFFVGWRRHGTVALTVTAPALERAEIAGSGQISIDRVAGAHFKGAVAGSGDLTLNGVDAQAVELGIAGSGSVRAVGKAQSVKLGIAGSGDIDASQLAALDAHASIAGSGGIKGHATRAASVDIMGSGDVEMTGGAKCAVSKAGSGSVRCS